MKIGIFTFFQTNYGAVLQAFALQYYLQQEHDADVEIIDFTTPNHLLDHKVIKKQKTRNLIKIIAYYFFSLIHYRQIKKRISRTWEFKKLYFKFTRRYSTIEDVLNNFPQKDIYITGSDQVFNPNARYVPVYYLNFKKGNSKKIAYAPSFGISEFTDEITNKIAAYVNDFDFLSCRESVGAEYLSKLTGKSIPVVVDPVLLIDEDQWAKVAVEPNYKKEYIFIYDLNGADALIKIAKDIQKNTGLPIVCLTGNRMKIYSVNKQIYDAGPAEFVGWIKCAKYIVTDSFHGTMFSLIFKKQFFTYIALEKTSSRIRNILREVNLSNRIITKQSLAEFDFKSYNNIQDILLDEIVRNSKLYIKEALSC